MAEGAKEDADYSYIVQAVGAMTEPRDLLEDSEAMQMEGELQYLGIVETDGGELIFRNNPEEVLRRHLE